MMERHISPGIAKALPIEIQAFIWTIIGDAPLKQYLQSFALTKGRRNGITIQHIRYWHETDGIIDYTFPTDRSVKADIYILADDTAYTMITHSELEDSMIP